MGEVATIFEEALEERGVEAGVIVVVQIKSGRGIMTEVKVAAVVVAAAGPTAAAAVEAAAAAVAMAEMRRRRDWNMSRILH